MYFDDIIVVGTTFQEHLHNLTSVLIRLRGAGLIALFVATPEVKFSAPSPDKGLSMKAHLARTSVYRFQPKMAITMRWEPTRTNHDEKSFELKKRTGGRGG